MQIYCNLKDFVYKIRLEKQILKGIKLFLFLIRIRISLTETNIVFQVITK